MADLRDDTARSVCWQTMVEQMLNETERGWSPVTLDTAPLLACVDRSPGDLPPVLDIKTRYAAEFVHVVGDKGRAERAGVGGDQQIVATNRMPR